MLEVSAHAFTCDAIFPMVIFLHDVFMFRGYIEMIMVPPAPVCNDLIAVFFSTYVATIAGIISTESFVHTHDNIFL